MGRTVALNYELNDWRLSEASRLNSESSRGVNSRHISSWLLQNTFPLNRDQHRQDFKRTTKRQQNSPIDIPGKEVPLSTRQSLLTRQYAHFAEEISLPFVDDVYGRTLFYKHVRRTLGHEKIY